MSFILTFCTLLGHGFFWIGIVNRLHALRVPRRLLGVLSWGALCVCLAGAAILVGAWWSGKDFYSAAFADPRQMTSAVGGFFQGYLLLCWIVLAATAVRWLGLSIGRRRASGVLRFHRRKPLSVNSALTAGSAGEHLPPYSVRLPGNQSLKLELTQQAFTVPRLPTALDGLTIVHLSDLHFTGKVGKAYFREVVEQSNALEPDLAAITGDIVDNPRCLDWIPDTLGQLRARHGVFFILGNHDLRVDEGLLRKTLVASSLVDLGGRWLRISIRGAEIILAGNELPWFAPAADFQIISPLPDHCVVPGEGQGVRIETEKQGPEVRDQKSENNIHHSAFSTQQPDLDPHPNPLPAGEGTTGPLRILLAHSPDQLGWARRRDVDLMLCGHSHGGQVRIPLLGALLVPSITGVKYDHGLFHQPPTIMHVTRGISGKLPLRWFCPPEIALLTLHSSEKD
jgi:predicted MPP superfamily phosphohydrolase